MKPRLLISAEIGPALTDQPTPEPSREQRREERREGRLLVAEHFLRAALANGARWSVDVVVEARARDIRRGELKAARQALGVRSKRWDEMWLWELPE